MTARLTRTERAACELALCLLRAHEGYYALRASQSAFRHAGCDTWCAWEHAWREATRTRVVRESTAPRLARARLALYLRALLRADRGDVGGRWECVSCGSREGGSRIALALLGRDPGPCCSAPYDEWTVRIRLLWQAAPPHDGRTPRQRRDALSRAIARELRGRG